MSEGGDLRSLVLETLQKQKGVLLAEPAIVHRLTYRGRDIIAKNSKSEAGYVDDRNYFPVEWWIMSTTVACNPIPKKNEGLTKIILNNGKSNVFLVDALKVAEKEIIGDYKNHWPLTKILDIGGPQASISFKDEPEVPPIPAHVHAGDVHHGKCNRDCGKLEAYFFPPVDIPPYNKSFGKVITRLGFKTDITKDHVLSAVKEFGKTDTMYNLLTEYVIQPQEGWLIRPGVIHAPGPWITFEIQKPQDDYNFLAWQLGQKINDKDLPELYQQNVLRGFKDEKDLLEQAIDWNNSQRSDFKEKYNYPVKVLEEGKFGRWMQIFFEEFYGEGFEINPGASYHRKQDSRPYAGLFYFFFFSLSLSLSL
eukprot:TRINITY_DN5589_c0_g1_i5.p1 TRINITY_DN5589_c0_g1~~TRINITY_DN5589_c0_g1_i5.p1  ORF type:complete len:372 (+),score=69.24 TRINITY_DN5589_c0_g1_i5:26-1117(+)